MKKEFMDQIVWGDGKVCMTAFTDPKDGSFGLCLSPSDAGHKPGAYILAEPEPGHMQEDGEFYLRFKNMDGLKALMASLVELAVEHDKSEGPFFDLTTTDYEEIYRRVRKGLEAKS